MGLTFVQGTVTGKRGKREMLNPFNRNLEPMRMMLASAASKRGSSS
jgi:hypothetical protein